VPAQLGEFERRDNSVDEKNAAAAVRLATDRIDGVFRDGKKGREIDDAFDRYRPFALVQKACTAQQVNFEIERCDMLT